MISIQDKDVVKSNQIKSESNSKFKSNGNVLSLR